jgi:hypothetical protein
LNPLPPNNDALFFSHSFLIPPFSLVYLHNSDNNYLADSCQPTHLSSILPVSYIET